MPDTLLGYYVLAIPVSCVIYLLQLRWMGALGRWYAGFVGGFTSNRQIVWFAIKVALFMPAFLVITEAGMLVFGTIKLISGTRKRWWTKTPVALTAVPGSSGKSRYESQANLPKPSLGAADF